jgi:HEAT repeat protein
MRKPVQFALAVWLVAITGFIAWQVVRSREPEPVYQGKRLSVWLEQQYTNHWSAGRDGELDKQTEAALKRIGTNALPLLLEMLHARDTTLKQVLMRWAAKRSLVHFNLISADQRRQEAILGYEALGPLACAQVPSLINALINDPSLHVRQAAASALAGIGPEARLAAPALFRATKDKDNVVRNNSFWALRHILPDPQLTIPVLIAGLDDPFPAARENAAFALGMYGQQARAAVPALVRTLSTNGAAGFSLKQIDPEAAAMEGVK